MIKNNLKLFIAVIIGVIIFTGIGVYAATQYYANQISFTPTNENFKKENGESINNVEDALNELYKKNSRVYLYKPNGWFLMKAFESTWSSSSATYSTAYNSNSIYIDVNDNSNKGTIVLYSQTPNKINLSNYKKIVVELQNVNIADDAQIVVFLSDNIDITYEKYIKKYSLLKESKIDYKLILDISDISEEYYINIAFSTKSNNIDWSNCDWTNQQDLHTGSVSGNIKNIYLE